MKPLGRMTLVVAFMPCAVSLSSARSQTTWNVNLGSSSFTPTHLTIDEGDTVHWVWVRGLHNVVSGVGGNHDGNFRSGNAGFNQTFDLVFDRAFLDAHIILGNVYPYYCIVHVAVGMVGTITVIVAADVDRDTDVDLDDYASIAPCLTGPDTSDPLPECTAKQQTQADINRDGNVDLRDIAMLQRSFTG